MPGANGIGDAPSLARLYAACVGLIYGVRLMTKASVSRTPSSGSSRPAGVWASGRHRPLRDRFRAVRTTRLTLAGPTSFGTEEPEESSRLRTPTRTSASPTPTTRSAASRTIVLACSSTRSCLLPTKPAADDRPGPRRCGTFPESRTIPDSLGGPAVDQVVALMVPSLGCSAASISSRPSPRPVTAASRPSTHPAFHLAIGDPPRYRAIALPPRRPADAHGQPPPAPHAQFRDFVAAAAIAMGRPVHHARQGLRDGPPPAADVARIFPRKPHPFSTVMIMLMEVSPRPVWTSFGTADRFEHALIALLDDPTDGRGLVRLPRRPGGLHRPARCGWVRREEGRTNCFMVEPEIWEAIDWFVETSPRPRPDGPAASRRRLLDPPELAARGYWSYDFILPGLLLHAFRL